MKGIDISHWNGKPFNPVTTSAFLNADFVICKATDGTNYSKYVPYFTWAIDFSLKQGKLIGAYHYATGQGSPVQEADYFVSVVKPYLGKILLALDWEGQNNRAWGNKAWCSKFLDRVKEKTGVTCFLYTGMEGIYQNKLIANKYPLWFAGYPYNQNSWLVPPFPSKYKIAPWTHYTIWQFTAGGGIDRNYTEMKKVDWFNWCKGNTAPATTPLNPQTDIAKASTLTLAYRTMKGLYGSGEARKQILGSRYAEVQKFINHIAWSLTSTLVKETLQGKYGNGDVRKTVLGNRYAAVQAKINGK